MIDNTQDLIDSREVNTRVEELEALLQEDGVLGLEDSLELVVLRQLQTDVEPYAADWQYGVTLIRGTYFKTYTMEYAEEITERDALRWPFNCIDWKQAADELKQDYTEVEFNGVTYYYR